MQVSTLYQVIILNTHKVYIPTSRYVYIQRVSGRQVARVLFTKLTITEKPLSGEEEANVSADSISLAIQQDSIKALAVRGFLVRDTEDVSAKLEYERRQE